MSRLVDILADTAEQQLQLALLNALCRSMNEELFNSAACDACLHTLLQCIATLVAASGKDPPEHVLCQLREAVATAQVSSAGDGASTWDRWFGNSNLWFIWGPRRDFPKVQSALDAST